MRQPSVVANNTPLVALWSIGRLPLLGDLFGSVAVPLAVVEEFLAGPGDRAAILATSAWLEPTEVASPRLSRAFAGLDRGEAEVLLLADQLAAELVLLDEKKARRVARRLGFAILGTMGILLLAKRRRLISDVGREVQHLVEQGFFVDRALVDETLRLAGEASG